MERPVNGRASGQAFAQPVQIPVRSVSLEGDLSISAESRGIVLFAHGSGSSRHSPRNRLVATELNHAGLATLLVDLLTAAEDEIDAATRRFRFDIGLLAERLTGALEWIDREARTRDLPVGLFGASTGAAAALIAAAERPKAVAAVVSRGGRPDLAGDALGRVRAPTLLIVGGNDPVVIDLNRAALPQLRAPKRLDIVPGATHLFEEAGTLEQVASKASQWFGQYLSRPGEPASVLPRAEDSSASDQA